MEMVVCRVLQEGPYGCEGAAPTLYGHSVTFLPLPASMPFRCRYPQFGVRTGGVRPVVDVGQSGNWLSPIWDPVSNRAGPQVLV